MEKDFHIIIITSDPEYTEFFRTAFSEDYSITAVKSIEEYLANVQRYSYHLLILDYDLFTHVTCLGCLRKLIEASPCLPVIVTSSWGNEEQAVEALKAGARDYIRKAPDQNYLKKMKISIIEIVKGKDIKADEDDGIIHFLFAHMDSFLQVWRKKITLMGNQIGSREQQTIDKEVLSRLYRAYLQDIKNDKFTETFTILKSIIWEMKKDDKYILNAELLNISFKEAMREFVMKNLSTLKGHKRDLMKKVGVIVDENNLSLSKEYEKVIGQSLKRIRIDERLATKYILLRTLQHEIRQPLSYIQNSAEILLTGECEEYKDKYIKNILEQAQKIEKLLIKLEDDSQMLLTNYSDDLLMVDVTWEGE